MNKPSGHLGRFAKQNTFVSFKKLVLIIVDTLSFSSLQSFVVYFTRPLIKVQTQTNKVIYCAVLLKTIKELLHFFSKWGK